MGPRNKNKLLTALVPLPPRPGVPRSGRGWHERSKHTNRERSPMSHSHTRTSTDRPPTGERQAPRVLYVISVGYGYRPLYYRRGGVK